MSHKHKLQLIQSKISLLSKVSTLAATAFKKQYDEITQNSKTKKQRTQSILKHFERELDEVLARTRAGNILR